MQSNLSAIAAQVTAQDINPEPRSGRQERLENIVNRYL
jgi:xylose isomerase